MTSYQNAIDYANNKMQMGEITVDQANVLIVQMMGVRVINNRLPADVRKALNAAVKTGELGHIKKEGLKPEVYHHKNARPKALAIREREMSNKMQSVNKVFGTSKYTPTPNPQP
jgi:hypothetical protein